MTRPFLLVIALGALIAPSTALADDPILPPPKQIEPAPPKNRFVADPITDFGMLSAAVGFSALLEQIIGTGELTPQQPTDPARLLSIDRSAVTRKIDKNASGLSNIGLGIAGGYAVLAPILTGVQEGAQAGLVDAIIFAESAAFTWSATNLAKIAVRRPRPLAYQLKKEQLEQGITTPIAETDTALSFFSGHASMTATISATATYLAFARSDKGSVRPWITLIAGTLLTTFVSVERVRAGKHFPTDVIAGSMAGAGIGVIVPHLHREDSLKQRPIWLGGSFGDDRSGGTVTLNGLF